jgi:hypothetical protein
MAIFTQGWFGGGRPDGRHRLDAPVELRPRASAAAGPPRARSQAIHVAAAPAWLGIVATIPGDEGDTNVWVFDATAARANGGGFVFASIGTVPVGALRGRGHRSQGTRRRSPVRAASRRRG